jgi:hypothetical protein
MTMLTKEWKSPDKLIIDRKPGWRYHYVRKDQVARRLEEGNGWEICYKNKQQNPESTSMDGACHYRGLILMCMPEDLAKQRDAWYINKHQKRLRASASGASLVAAAKKASGNMIDSHGNPLTGVLGNTVITDEVVKEGVTTRRSSESFNSGAEALEVAPEDIQELQSVKDKQKKDLVESEKEEVREVEVKRRGRPKGSHKRR